MIDEQSSASGHDYASDRSAIGAGWVPSWGTGVFAMYCVYMLPVLYRPALFTTWTTFFTTWTTFGSINWLKYINFMSTNIRDKILHNIAYVDKDRIKVDPVNSSVYLQRTCTHIVYIRCWFGRWARCIHGTVSRQCWERVRDVIAISCVTRGDSRVDR